MKEAYEKLWDSVERWGLSELVTRAYFDSEGAHFILLCSSMDGSVGVLTAVFYAEPSANELPCCETELSILKSKEEFEAWADRTSVRPNCFGYGLFEAFQTSTKGTGFIGRLEVARGCPELLQYLSALRMLLYFVHLNESDDERRSYLRFFSFKVKKFIEGENSKGASMNHLPG